MIAETGHFALILAFSFAVIGGILSLYGAAKGFTPLIRLASRLAITQFFLLALAFGALIYSFVISDFSLAIVTANSHTEKPLLYKISGVWGNHEGSLVLWVFILTLFGAAVALFGKGLPDTFKARALAVQSLIGAGFLAFLLFTSNPFERLVDVPLEGRGLNPLLQDPGLAFHPPFLYLGYVGLSVAFSFAIAALIEGRVNAAWARWVRPWTLAAWSFLTAGIALGSWWAYYELGWGGWWFWDPVENASFMPWLAATALLHSAIVVEKREALKSWTVLLAILAFSLSLIGTFLVRSGVLTSVHAFATDPARGVFILAFLVVVIGGSLLLYAIRASSLRAGSQFRMISREGALVLNNLLVLIALGTVLVGTLYPLFIDALLREKLTVGPPYFEATFVPLSIPLFLVLAVGPLLTWKRSDLKLALKRMRFPFIFSLISFVMVLMVDGASLLAALGVAVAVWLAGGVLRELILRAGDGRDGVVALFRRLLQLPRAQWGMTLAHMGLAVLLVGITASEVWTEERITVLNTGESTNIGAFAYRFDGVAPVSGPNYTAIRGFFTVLKNNKEIAILTPEDRTYWSPTMQTTEAGIQTRFLGDLYAVIGDPVSGGGWSVRLYVKPFIAWIWWGAVLMVLGGTFSLSDRRLRFGLLPARNNKDVKEEGV